MCHLLNVIRENATLSDDDFAQVMLLRAQTGDFNQSISFMLILQVARSFQSIILSNDDINAMMEDFMQRLELIENDPIRDEDAYRFLKELSEAQTTKIVGSFGEYIVLRRRVISGF